MDFLVLESCKTIYPHSTFISFSVVIRFLQIQNKSCSVWKKKNPSYYPILILALIISAIGSFIPGFKEFYPRAPTTDERLLYHATWITTLVFEIVYLYTFYFTEFFFRKFLIRYLKVVGRYHAVGMAALIYGMVHFQKPRGEILSSFLVVYWWVLWVLELIQFEAGFMHISYSLLVWNFLREFIFGINCSKKIIYTYSSIF